MSPIQKNDDPLSLNELQGSLLGSHSFKSSIERGAVNKEDLNSKSQLRENAISNLPASIRRVKEEIKRKIEE